MKKLNMATLAYDEIDNDSIYCHICCDYYIRDNGSHVYHCINNHILGKPISWGKNGFDALNSASVE